MANGFDMSGIDRSWAPFVESEAGFLEEIGKKIASDELCPEPGLILRFARTDLAAAKVVILGQDPYPQKGTATGRAFEVGGLKSFLDPFPQSSLKNILRLIYAAYSGECIGWTGLKEKIKDGSFGILPPDRLFSSWERQGVLLLNSSLSCRAGEPMSHMRLWQPFSERLIRYVTEEKPELCWFLWGKNAERAAHNVTGRRYVSRHPMLCGGKSEDDFLKNPCFYETKDLVSWTGVE